MKRSHLAREIIETIALTLLIFCVIRFAVQNYLVDGISMQPGLKNNEYVLVNKMAYLFHGPQRGDVIVFHWPLDTSKDLIKRVIGLPGDTVSINGNSVWVDNVLLKEPYLPLIKGPANPIANVWKVSILVPSWLLAEHATVEQNLHFGHRDHSSRSYRRTRPYGTTA